MKILYKKDSKDKIRVWQVSTQGGLLLQESGVLDGKLVQHSKICKGKNLGKSNETTREEQALSEMVSLIREKLSEGYFETIDQAKNEEVILPMLAKSYEDEKHKIDWSNCFEQPKLDGMRCLAHINGENVVLKSRDGKIIENMDHIKEELSRCTAGSVVLDGELYAHGLSFQENMKLIKKYRPNETEKVHYHVYDVVMDSSFDNRSYEVASLVNILNSPVIEQVKTTQVLSEEEMKKEHIVNISNGYEGTMIRHSHDSYKTNGRSSSLLKYKDFQDITAEIIDILPNEASPLHGTPLLKYSNQKLTGVSESIFKAGVKMSYEDREDLLTNKQNYIGKTAEIRFFEWTDNGNPRFPVMVGIRLDK